MLVFDRRLSVAEKNEKEVAAANDDGGSDDRRFECVAAING